MLRGTALTLVLAALSAPLAAMPAQQSLEELEERELHATIAVDPHYAPAYLWLGDLPYDRRPKLWQEERKGKIPEALRPAVEQVYRLRRQAFLIDPMTNDYRTNPDDATTVLELGVILAEAGRAAEQAAAANPRDPRPMYHLGVVRQQLAKPGEAREALTRFVAIAPLARTERQITDAKQRLAALGPGAGTH
jgi:cytochrome c-type biogenesis protein CcmH/NrfG